MNINNISVINESNRATHTHIMPSKTVVLITGANSGIGYEAAKALLQSKKSYHVLLGARSREKGEAATDQLRKEIFVSPSSIEFVQVDILSNESIREAFQTVEAKYGVLDVLINNAGMFLNTLLLTSFNMRK